MDDTPEREHTYDNEAEQEAYERHAEGREAEEDAAPAGGGEPEDAEDEEVGGG